MMEKLKLKEKEWYWLSLDDFDGRPFGQIIEFLTDKIVRIKFGVFRGSPVDEAIEIKLLDIKYIEKRMTAEDKVNILPDLL